MTRPANVGRTRPEELARVWSAQAGSAPVRAERLNTGNGRVYQVSFRADDGQGGSCTGVVTVSVPHSLKNGATAIDDGPAYDSTIP